MKTYRHFLFLLVLLLSFAVGALTVSLIITCRNLARESRVLSTIPLRDDQRKQSVFQAEGEMHHVSFYNDSTFLYTSGNTLFLQHLKGNRPEIVFKGHTQPIQDYEVSPDGRRLASASQDGTLRLWDLVTGECLAISQQVDTLSQPGWTMLHDIVYSRDGKRILSADMTGIKTWKAYNLELLSSEESDAFYMCSGLLSPNEQTFCTRIPDVPKGFNIFEHKMKGNIDYDLLTHIGERDPISYSTDGKRLLVANFDKGSMEVLDIDPKVMYEQRSILWFYSPEIPLYAAALSRDGKQLVSAHSDGTIRIWNAENGAEREILHWAGRPVDGICFSPNGTRVLAYCNSTGEFCIWGPFSWMI